MRATNRPQLLPPRLGRAIPLGRNVRLPIPPGGSIRMPRGAVADGGPRTTTTQRGLTAILGQGTSQNVFAVGLSSNRRQALFTFLSPTYPGYELLRPTLGHLTDSFGIIVCPISIVNKRRSASHITPLLYRGSTRGHTTN